MFRFNRLALASLFICAGLTPAHAANFCVSTGDQLAAALATASGNSQADTIRVRTGVLTRTSADAHDYIYQSGENLDLSGGWTGAGNACSTQTYPAGQTTLDGEYESAILKVFVQTGFGPTISIYNLGFYRGAASVNGTASVDIEINAGTTANLRFARNSIIQSISTAGGTAGLRARAASGEMRIVGNLIVGNASEGASGNGGAQVSALTGALLYFNNNTVSSNSHNNPQIGASGVYFYAMTPMWISNNVITGNTSLPASNLQYKTDTNGSGQQMHFANNHFGAVSTGAALASTTISETGTLFGDPGFVSANDRHLAAGSILRDSGLNNAPGGYDALDLSGQARPQGGSIDRGAYEFETPVLFVSGFE
jgi:hypothetical protein